MRLPVPHLHELVRTLELPQHRFPRAISIADSIDCWLPNGGLPANCVHEVKGAGLAGALAFSFLLAGRVAGEKGNIVYISHDRSLHVIGLQPYKVSLDRLLHVRVRRKQDLAWAALEALRCPQVSAVIGAIGNMDLTASRRLQLAAETNGTTGFFLGNATSAIASPITRWKVSPLGKVGQRFDEPAWTLELLYCRGGGPATWAVQWRDGKLQTRPAKPVQRSVPHAEIETLAG